VVREFVVHEGRERDFETVFGRDGIWAELLRRSQEFVETDCKPELETDRRYRVTDRWYSHQGFESFREEYQQEYEKFSRLILNEGLVERETVLGSFYEDGPDESGLVLK